MNYVERDKYDNVVCYGICSPGRFVSMLKSGRLVKEETRSSPQSIVTSSGLPEAKITSEQWQEALDRISILENEV